MLYKYYTIVSLDIVLLGPFYTTFPEVRHGTKKALKPAVSKRPDACHRRVGVSQMGIIQSSHDLFICTATYVQMRAAHPNLGTKLPKFGQNVRFSFREIVRGPLITKKQS